MSYFEERMAEIKDKQEAEFRHSNILLTLRPRRKKSEQKPKEKPSKRFEYPEPDEYIQPLSGHVYFLKADNMVKIGFSTNVRARITELRVGASGEVKLVALVPGHMDTERYFHKMFEKYRDHGEWFRVEDDLKLFLRRMPSHIPQTELVKKPKGRL